MKLENRFTVPVPRAKAWDVLLDVERIAPCMPGAKLLSRDGDEFTGQVKVKVGPINLTYGGQAKFVSLDEAAGVAVIEGSGKETRGTGTAKATITCRLIDKGQTTDVEVDTDLNVTGKPASFGRGVLADVSSKLVDQFAACLSEEIQQGQSTGASRTEPGSGATPPAAPATVAGLQVGMPGSPDGPPAVSGTEIAIEQATAAAPAPASAVGSVAGVGAGGGPAVGAGATDPSAGNGATGPAADTTPSAPRPPRKEAEPINLVDTAAVPVLKRLLPAVGAAALLVLLLRRLMR